MDEWKSTYEGYVSQWQADSSAAREKALATRKRIEEERDAEQKAALEEEVAVRKAEETKKEREERLRRELEDRIESSQAGKDGNGQRDDRVKEAWELVKSTGEGEGKEVVSDARGVTDQDVLAGQTNLSGAERSEVKQVCLDLLPLLTRRRPCTTQPHPPSRCPRQCRIQLHLLRTLCRASQRPCHVRQQPRKHGWKSLPPRLQQRICRRIQASPRRRRNP